MVSCVCRHLVRLERRRAAPSKSTIIAAIAAAIFMPMTVHGGAS